MIRDWTPNRIRWSLRKLTLPVRPSDLVLEVGSGSNPHPAADVLLERYVATAHRPGAPLVADRPTVLADACRMPFADKSFDFVIAFHVLEHVADPALFLRELQRVGKAGYIETPNVMFERLVPYDVHVLEIMDINGTLRILKKPSARHDRFLNELDIVSRNAKWHSLFYDNPSLFHVQHLWEGEIRFQIQNPETSSEWVALFAQEGAEEASVLPELQRLNARAWALSMIRGWHKLRKPKVELATVLVCPDCHGTLSLGGGFWLCAPCETRYPATPLPDFLPKTTIAKGAQ